ncbi:MAG: RNA 2'-phosphotransferase [Crenarchaeota archaeon]|nr:RNA 2'-phosphotransferase [Thermoproteota archaeon]
MKSVYRCRKCGSFTELPYHCGEQAELVIDGVRRVKLSKLMAFLLRHCPESAGLELDDGGWVPIDELARAIRERWRNRDEYRWVQPLHIMAVALTDPKGRYEVRNGLIRARYGHASRLGLKIEYPLDRSARVLYHGTTRRALTRILREGVKPMRRMFVHLSTTLGDACSVGKRHGNDVVVLVIDAECLRSKGIRVYEASSSVRTVEYVPPECIERVVEC